MEFSSFWSENRILNTGYMVSC